MRTFKIDPAMEKLADKPATACFISPNPDKIGTLYNAGRAFECALGAYFFGASFALNYKGDNIPRENEADLIGTPYGDLSLKSHNATLGAYRPVYGYGKAVQVGGFLRDSKADNYAFGVELASGKWQVFILSPFEMMLFLNSPCWAGIEKGQRVKQRVAVDKVVSWLFSHLTIERL